MEVSGSSSNGRYSWGRVNSLWWTGAVFTPPDGRDGQTCPDSKTKDNCQASDVGEVGCNDMDTKNMMVDGSMVVKNNSKVGKNMVSDIS